MHAHDDTSSVANISQCHIVINIVYLAYHKSTQFILHTINSVNMHNFDIKLQASEIGVYYPSE